MVEDRIRTCSTCVKSDVCPYKESFISTVKEASEIEDRKNIFAKVIVECCKWAPITTNNIRKHQSNVWGRFQEEFKMDILAELEHAIRNLSEDQFIEFINNCGRHSWDWENLFAYTDFSKLDSYGGSFITLLYLHSKNIIQERNK